ncbi:MAG: glycosyltransferase family 10 [Patescibacteria group bacterium]|nr:glycosyltransferase family 10 [Patescibacteria group bacterium]
MIKATLVVTHPSFLHNRFFSTNIKIIRDHQNDCFVQLRNKLRKHGIDLATEDINKIDTSKLVIYLDINKIPKISSTQISYLIINEPPTVHSQNWDKKNHQFFDKIFTWYKPLVDNKKYFFLRLGYLLNSDLSKNKQITKRKLCTTIIGYKHSYHPQELYSERLKAIKWFADNHPADFDLYGQSWSGFFLPGFLRLCKSILPRQFFSKWLDREDIYQVYRGAVDSKQKVLQKYVFSICYENTKDTPDLITEKIFDSMCAGCIPIYLGAPNIAKLIPDRCYIDKRKFSSYRELYQFLAKIDEKSYQKYISNIQNFLNSSKSRIFTSDYYADTIVKEVLKDLTLV